MRWRFIREWARTVAIAAAIPAAGAALVLVASVVGSSGQSLVESAGIDESSTPVPRAVPESSGGTRWWEGAAGALLGALIGSCIPLFVSRRARWIERKGELVAMRVEMALVLRSLQEIIEQSKSGATAAPQQQLSLTVFERALPKLIGEGMLKDDEINSLVEYVARTEEINRGLELARQASTANNLTTMQVAMSRNRGLAMTMTDAKEQRFGNRTNLDGAVKALSRLSVDESGATSEDVGAERSQR